MAFRAMGETAFFSFLSCTWEERERTKGGIPRPCIVGVFLEQRVPGRRRQCRKTGGRRM